LLWLEALEKGLEGRRRRRKWTGYPASPFTAWPSTSLQSTPVSSASISYSELVDLQRKTRERLQLLCDDDADLNSLVTELQEYEEPRSYFSVWPTDRATKWSQFGSDSMIGGEPLGNYLDK